LREPGILPQNGGVGLITVDVALRMHELAPLAKAAESVLMESFAGSGHEVLGKMGLFYEIVRTMGVGALVAPSAVSLHLPVLAHLGFLLELVFFFAVGALYRFLIVARFGGGRRVRMNFVDIVLDRDHAPIFLHVTHAVGERS